MKATQKVNIQVVWEEFFKKRDEETRNILIEHYLPTVKYTAERIHARLPKNVELNDLISAGVFGLIAAIHMFKPELRVKFETYCRQRIRGFILDELRKTDWIPRLVRSRATQLRKATQRLEAQLGRLPTEMELAKELDLDMKKFHHLQRDANAAILISLSKTVSCSDGDNELREIDIINNQKSINPLIEAEKHDIKDFITKGLSSVERLILILYYYEELTMKEIGMTLGISESRVSQMHSSIIARLKAQIDSRTKLVLSV